MTDILFSKLVVLRGKVRCFFAIGRVWVSPGSVKTHWVVHSKAAARPTKGIQIAVGDYGMDCDGGREAPGWNANCQCRK